MADFGDQQFYDVRGPEQEPTKEPRFNRKIISRLVFLVAIVVLIITSTVIVWNIIKNYTADKKIEEVAISNIITAVERKIDACEETEREYCKNKYWSEAAVDNGNIDFCNQVDEDWFVSCVKLVANNLSDVQICKKIVDESRVECEDNINYKIAIEQNDLTICADVSDEILQTKCISTVALYLAGIDECPLTGIGAIECAERQKLILAVDDGECNRFTTGSTLSISCIDILEIRDTDGDGLSDLEEIQDYKTDHRNADTDGDGFDDGIEIENGFDPLN